MKASSYQIFIVSVFVSVFPAFSEEIVESKAEKQIIVASDSACEKKCEVNINICKSDCDYSRESYHSTWCSEACHNTYKHCLESCDRKNNSKSDTTSENIIPQAPSYS